MKGICRVCDLLDNDTSTKTVYYCKACKAAMCIDCESNWVRRGLAMIKEKTNGRD